MLNDNAVLTAPEVITLEGPSGVFAEVLDNGALRRLEAFGTSLLLHPATCACTGRTASVAGPSSGRPAARS